MKIIAKKFIVGLLFICSITNAYSQWSGKANFDKSTWSAFKKGKLLVVLTSDGESKYDEALKKSIEQHWTYNEYEFIDATQYMELNLSPANFFLVTINLNRRKSQEGVTYVDQDFTYLYISQGRAKGKILSYPPLADIQTGDSETDFTLQLDVFIKYLQWYSNLVTSGKVANLGDFKKITKASRSKIKTKPLYVWDIDLNEKITSVEDIKKVYTGEVHVVSAEELSAVIEEGGDVHLFVCIKLPGKAWDYVYNIKTGAILYHSYNLISNAWPEGMIPYHYKKWQ